MNIKEHLKFFGMHNQLSDITNAAPDRNEWRKIINQELLDTKIHGKKIELPKFKKERKQKYCDLMLYVANCL